MASFQPLAPLSVGNVVSAAISLYRSHFKTYLGISLRATLWQMLPVLAFIFVGFAIGLTGQANNNLNDLPLALLILGGIVAIVLWGIGLTKSLVNSALISRLAFKELIHQPEGVKVARKTLLSKQWSFLIIALQIGFFLVVIYFGLAIAFAILVFALAFILSTIIGQGFLSAIIGGLLSLAAFLACIFLFLWCLSRWLIAEVPLAIEPNLNSGESINRSWRLTQNSVLAIQLICLIAFLVTLPIIGLTNFIPQLFLIGIPQGTTLYWIMYISFSFLGLVGNLFVLSFWQTIKAVLYYDLRNRKEGLTISLRDSQ